MPETGLRGSFSLTDEKIDEIVTKTSPGVYVLGHSDNNSFVVKYVGRSDDDLNKRLHDWVGEYARFKFGYFDSEKAAFERECRIWHNFGGPNGDLDNQVHPARPKGSNWECPVCDIFD